jgi:hypothetical protein
VHLAENMGPDGVQRGVNWGVILDMGIEQRKIGEVVI